MPKMNINRSILISKKAEEIYPLINNFDNWGIWSPWLILEKDVKVTVSDDKKYYEWQGDLTGEGNMKITHEKANELVNCDLMFLKPWKSKAKIGFTLKAEGDATRVSWWMESSLPFFMFFMKKMMEAFISMDYDRGLNMLKDLAEDGKVHSELDFVGDSDYEGCTYIGIQATCSLDEMKDSMSSNFKTLMEFTANDQSNMDGAPFSIYHKWNVVKKQCSYSACIPVKNIPDNLPSEIISAIIPKTKMNSVHHLGPYRHMGNAWSAMYSRQRAKKFKLNKAVDPIEVYLNSPVDTSENELKTEIYFPIK
jgi:predicted transcriptional regulator YdeE